MKRTLLAALSLVVALAFGVGTYAWLVADVQLAFVLSLTYGLGVWLYGEWGKFLRAAGAEWQTNRWRIASTSFMLVVAMFGIGPAVPVPADVRLAIQLLILGAAWVGMMLGVASISDQPDLSERTETQEPDSV